MKTFPMIRFVSSVCFALVLGSGLNAAERSKPAVASANQPAAAKVDINTADLQALESLPGVGPQTARAIIAHRPFSSVSDLERVPGIGEAKMKDLKGKVTASRQKTQKEITAPAREANSPRTTVKPTHEAAPTETRHVSSTAAHLHRVNLNTASQAELEALPEIGPVKAQAIIDARPFSSIEDVMRVKGIKEQTFKAIQEQITVR